ncbi:MAG: class I SAM-dependent rRNA methyltransferase [Verrucomicrobiales bacterium]
MATLIIKPRARIFHGHEWVYSMEVQKTIGEPEAGGVVSLVDYRQKPLGSAIYNPKSQIVARRFSRRRQKLDREFFVRRIRRANEYRQRLMAGREPADVYRMVWSESDGLPGLVVDRYGAHCVVQTLTLAMDQRRELIVEALRDVCDPVSIVERNEATIRVAEGMEPRSGVLYGEVPTPFRVTTPHGVFVVDLQEGQKTGLYLDQFDNYGAVAALAKGKRVLDCFCNQGGFALACAKAGATSVLGLDASEAAVAVATANAAESGLAGRCSFMAANVFDFLKAAESSFNQPAVEPVDSGESGASREGRAEEKAGLYDLIILDPPSFTRNKGSLRDALRGYKEIHLRALKLLRPGGLLSTFSCSHHVSRSDFRLMIVDAATDAKRTLRQVLFHGQRADHPIIPSIPETEYLKGYTYELMASW